MPCISGFLEDYLDEKLDVNILSAGSTSVGVLDTPTGDKINSL